jgi:hypothetical protein
MWHAVRWRAANFDIWGLFSSMAGNFRCFYEQIDSKASGSTKWQKILLFLLWTHVAANVRTVGCPGTQKHVDFLHR